MKGVRYVVDAGFVKARGYHASAGIDSLQASLKRTDQFQRKHMLYAST